MYLDQTYNQRRKKIDMGWVTTCQKKASQESLGMWDNNLMRWLGTTTITYFRFGTMKVDYSHLLYAFKLRLKKWRKTVTTEQDTSAICITIDSHMNDICMKVSRCEYGSLKDSLIRDRLVIGASDQACREKLLRERPARGGGY